MKREGHEGVGLLNTPLVERALKAPWVIKLLGRVIPPLDRLLLRISRGWISTAMQTIVLMETTGAKSGLRRETVTLCMRDGDNIVLVGSNWGLPAHPAWVFNLRANPETLVRFRGYVGSMRAREINGSERADMWSRLVHHNPQYQRYAEGTERELPVLLLERSSAPSTH
ncbi:MAG: nitroreductase family deazaflavin-dependent oxidoreductase [Halieaceae bacterium]|jgi:deazaflavin-dependent oxidoreductase (nitroreductase family)|nr:nitroreductase family deazaflavin-dependent oxidoreductase [Halieaceae bacterium]